MALNSTQEAYLRQDRHKTDLYCTALPPIFIWRAQINDVTMDKGKTTIAFDNGASLGATGLGFSNISVNQTVWVGTSVYVGNIARLRIRSISSGDGGVSGTVVVGGHSYDLENDHYLTFIHTYELHTRFSYIDLSEVFYKDDDVTYAASGNANSQPDPVCIAGCHQAKFINDGLGYAQFDVDISDSYVLAQGASKSTYSIEVFPTPTTTSFNTSTGTGYVRCATANYYWAKFGVQDSNGKWGYTYRLLAAHSTDPTSDMFPIVDFEINSLAGDWEGAGWTASISFFSDTEFGDWYDGSLCILWGDYWYWNDTNDEYDEVNINSLPDINSNVLFVGYLNLQNIQSDPETGAHINSFDLFQITDLLKIMPTYSWPLEAIDTVDEWWKYASWLTVGRGAMFMLQWNSTAPLVTDCIGFNTGACALYRKYIEFEQASLYESINNITETFGSRSKLISDRGNRLRVTENINLLNDTDRAAITPYGTIYEEYLGEGLIEIIRNSNEQVSQVYTSGFTYDGALGEPQPVYALAPGEKPSDGGPPENQEKQTYADQNDANDTAGRFWSIKNSKYGEVRINLVGQLATVLDPAIQTWWLLSLTSDTNIRNLTWTNKKLALRTIDVIFEYDDTFTGHIEVSCVFEVEADPMDGIPWFYPEDYPEEGDDGQDDEINGTTSVNGALYTGSSVQFLDSNSANWSQKSADNVNDFEADYFWRSKQASQSYDDAILVYCQNGAVKRSTDGGDSWSTISMGTPTNTFGDSPAPGAGDVNYTMLECNRGSDDGQFVFIGRWQNSGGTWRSWIIWTTDFSSITWEQLT